VSKVTSKVQGGQTVTKTQQPASTPRELANRASQPAPKRTAPVRSAPQHPGVTTLNKKAESKDSQEKESNKTESTAKVKRGEWTELECCIYHPQ